MTLLAIVAIVKESFAPAREQTVSFYWCTNLYRRKRHDVCDEDARDIDTRSDSQCNYTKPEHIIILLLFAGFVLDISKVTSFLYKIHWHASNYVGVHV